ncbi:hypothetical protein ACO0QE_000356 [Hanseniaspora vineae]
MTPQLQQLQQQQAKTLQQSTPLNQQQLTPQQKQQLLVIAQQLRVSPQQVQQLTPLQVHHMQQKMRQHQQRQNAISLEQQFNMVMGSVYPKPKRLYKFVEDSDSILKKYEKFMQSFELHIYESAYKICPPNKSRSGSYRQEFGGDGLTLSKNDETLKDFLEYVARGLIPASLIDILADSNIQFYEGNLILQVFDHTNTTDVSPPTKKPVPTQAGETTNANKNGTHDKQQVPKQSLLKRPRIYRTLLRPNDLTTYYDMLTMSDEHKLSDAIYQNVEAEILNLTKRNLNLSVPRNPYDSFNAQLEQKLGLDMNVKLNYRELCSDQNSRGANPHTEMVYKQPTSSYEEMMLQYSTPVQRRNFLGFAVDFKNSNAGKALLARMANQPQLIKEQQQQQQQLQQQQQQQQQQNSNGKAQETKKRAPAKPRVTKPRAQNKGAPRKRQVKPKEDKPKDEKPKVRRPRKKKGAAAAEAEAAAAPGEPNPTGTAPESK